MLNSEPPTEENELAERLGAGDPTAMIEVANIYLDRVYFLVFQSVGRKHTKAEDITTETFLSALQLVRDFNCNSKIYTWLVGIAYNKMTDYFSQLEQEGKYVDSPPDDKTAGTQQILGNGVSVADEVEHAEERVVMEKALSRLPFDYREVILLRHIEDMSVSEISQIMHRSPESIKELLTLAQKALRDNINKNLK